jgi:hypothetical protein
MTFDTDVASIKLSKELFELSGWLDCYFIYYGRRSRDGSVVIKEGDRPIIPAYDLSYLLRKLPVGTTIKRFKYPEVGGYEAEYLWEGDDGTGEGVSCGADTPEDATCKLAIAGFKEGWLKREGEK